MQNSNIVKTKREIEELGHSIENDMICSVDVDVIAHFGNCCCLQIECNNVMALVAYNNTQNLGYMIRALVELLEIDREDGIRLSEMRNIPVRLIFSGKGGWGSKCIGFGHFMKDRFVLNEDFVQVSLSNNPAAKS